ncbi:MAG: adaptor protein MecA [Agathobacter sp.]|nr:adaptor protein MecA [Agathobacter sp.]
MKIEKVNENQIRCTLSKSELAERHLKVSELAYGTEKAKALFHDMIEKANDEFGFEVDDMPVMIEAIPLSGENIILQITKVEYPEELDTRFSRFSESEEEDYDNEESETSIFKDPKGADDVLGLFQKMKEDLEQQVEEKEKHPEKVGAPKEEGKDAPPKRRKPRTTKLVKIYEFKSIDQVERLAHVLGSYYNGENDLYKDEKKNRYCLFVRKSSHTPEEFNKVCNIITEYASYRKYTAATEAFFKEHGKIIVKGNALQMLRTL